MQKKRISFLKSEPAEFIDDTDCTKVDEILYGES